MRVLLVRAGALGDLLLLRTAIHALAGASCSVALLAPERAALALTGGAPPEIDELIPFDGRDVAALLAGAPSGAFVQRLRAQARVVAYTRDPELLRRLEAAGLSLVSHDPTPPPGRHAADWLADPIRDLVATGVSAPPPIEPTDAERREAEALARDLPAGFLALHPGSGSPRKNWPAARFAALLDRLSPGRPYLLVRGPADAAAAAELERDPHARVARELPLRVLGALLARAGLYVGNDSGVSHLAAAYGTPSLVLFGPTDAATWRPVGVRVRVAASPTSAMEDLSVEAATCSALGLPCG
jgi:ADP-heptose:LPS heptosyltransferase